MATRAPCPKEELVHVFPTWGPEHSVDGLTCWCHPIPDELEPYVIVHKEPEEASH